MEKELTKTKKTVSTVKTTMSVDVTNSVNNITTQHNHESRMGSGACMVDGCGCPEFIDSEGTCFNINSDGGTCNHLESDHA